MKTLESWAIHAYADNELEAGERAEVEQLIAENPEAQAQLADIRRHTQAIRDAHAGIIDEPLPPVLVRTARQAPSPLPRQIRWQSIAAALALLFTGAMGGYLASRYQAGLESTSFVEVAVGAHEVYSGERRHPVEVAAAEQDHLQKWLSKRIGVSFAVPDLSDQGYTLLGGRLLAEGGRPAALLMYEDAEKRRLSVYLAANPKRDTGDLALRQQGGLTVCYWQEPDMVYALVGQQSDSEMKLLAKAAHDRFDS